MEQGRRVFSLVQGDVGCGKTLIAWFAAYLVAMAGGQAAILCPTSVLASQHAKDACSVLARFNVRSCLMTSRLSSDEQEANRQAIAKGAIQVIVGTHRLFQDDMVYRDLRLVVVDEQHRFGVKQRSKLLRKGKNAHYLGLSATPIPRSLALTLYADYDVHQIMEMPKGRLPVKTILKKSTNRDQVVRFAKTRIAHGEAVFWVVPLVEGDEENATRSAVDVSQTLAQSFGSGRVGLAHGQMERGLVEDVMQRLQAGELDVVVATTVIEVGVDVGHATVMVIDGADRFGLSQLHQLRGRVGRRDRQGTCFLIVDVPVAQETLERLRVMERIQDGFAIAEYDLAQRGFGALMGTTQSGFMSFRVADPWLDRQLFLTIKAVVDRLAPVPEYQRWVDGFPFAQ